MLTARSKIWCASPLRLTPMACPLYRTWTDPAHFDLDQLITTLGNIPPELIEVSFDMLRPFQKTAGRLKLLDNVHDDAFVKAHLRFERWAADQIPFAGETARQFITDFMRENKLVRNEFSWRTKGQTSGRSVSRFCTWPPSMIISYRRKPHVIDRLNRQQGQKRNRTQRWTREPGGWGQCRPATVAAARRLARRALL